MLTTLMEDTSPLGKLASRYLTDVSDSRYIQLNLPSGETPRLLSRDFIEWFRGFTDAEGCFSIIVNNAGKAMDTANFRFEFSIGVHFDDQDVLTFIRDTLRVGKVSVKGKDIKKRIAFFTISSKSELEVIMAIFKKYNLNTTKHLDFLCLAQAYILYTKDSRNTEYRLKLKATILRIKDSMNSKRSYFYMPYKITVTQNWLLGFVEGDGSFSALSYGINAHRFTFSIKQKNINKAVLEAIKDFLLRLSPDSSIYFDKEGIGIWTDNSTNTLNLMIRRLKYIEEIIIPLFNSLTFHSKKSMDYYDWVSLFNIQKSGLHLLPEGKELIKRILSQMNNNRLSTSGKPAIDRDILMRDIAKLLSKSNYVVKEDGRIWIISQNKYLAQSSGSGGKRKGVALLSPEGTIIKTFYSLTECGNFLGVTRKTITNKLAKGQAVLFDERLCSLQYVDSIPSDID